MKRINTLRELQLISIYIYNDLRNFCNSNGLQVYLHGGTLIGALRHKGYIPWDDDIDVCMSRIDYEKMLSISNGNISEKCYVIDPERNLSFNGYIPVVIYKNSKMHSGQYRTDEDLHIGISIFIYDGIITNYLLQKLYYIHMFILRAEHALCRANFKHVNTKTAKIVGPILQKFYKTNNILKFKNKILKLQKKYPYENCVLVSTNADFQSSREVCKKTDFEKAIRISFEGIESYTYSHFDSHLKKYYGNYMQLPTQRQQVSKHKFNAWIEDNFNYFETNIFSSGE